MIEERDDIDPVAVALALSGSVVGAATGLTRRAASALGPVGRVLLGPPWLPRRLHPRTVLQSLAREGELRRSTLAVQLARGLDILVPVVLAEVLRRAAVTELVLRYVDLDRVVAGVDLDTAASRLDVAAIVEQVEVDPVVARVDLDAVLDRIDMESVLDRIDMESVLDRIDLTAIVLERVDLDVLIQAILDRIDLIGLAGEVIEGVDLPEIIRASTGSMASDTVQGARMQSIVADEAVSRAVDRFFLRRRHRSTHAPGSPEDSATEEFPPTAGRDGPGAVE